MKTVLLLISTLFFSGCATVSGSDYVGVWDIDYPDNNQEVVKLTVDGTASVSRKRRSSAPNRLNPGYWRVDKDNVLFVFIPFRHFLSMKATITDDVLLLTSAASRKNNFTFKRELNNDNDGYLGSWVGTKAAKKCSTCESTDFAIQLTVNENGLASLKMQEKIVQFAWLRDKSDTLIMNGNLHMKAEIIDGVPVFTDRVGRALEAVKKDLANTESTE